MTILDTDKLLPSRISQSMFDRPSVGASALLRGDLSGAGLAILSPQRLGPSRQRTLADEWGVGQGNSAYDFVIRSITNPLVMLGAILAVKYPVPLAGNMFKYAKKLSGLSRAANTDIVIRQLGSIDDIFPGTAIPDAYKSLVRSVETFRRGHADGVAAAVVKAQKRGLPWNQRTQVLLSAKLDGLDVSKIELAGERLQVLKPIDEGKVFGELVDDIRGIQDDLWDAMFDKKWKRDAIQFKTFKKLTKYDERQDFYQEFPLAQKGKLGPQSPARKALSQAARYRNSVLRQHFFSGLSKETHYWPHQVPRTAMDWEENIRKMMAETVGVSRRMHGDMTLRATEKQGAASASARAGTMAPDPKDLKIISEYVNPAAEAKIGDFLGQVSKDGTRHLPYSLRFMETMSSYIHSLSKAHGWTLAKGPKGRPLGTTIMDEVNALQERGAGGAIRAAMMRDTYIPLALGRQTFKQAMSNLKWSEHKRVVGDWLLTDKTAKAAIPSEMRSWMVNKLSDSSGVMSLNNLSARMTGYLYLSALGGNPVSASYNLMQTLLTTVPTIGAKYTAIGLKKTFNKAPSYFKARHAGKTHEAALSSAFPEYAEAGIVANPLVDEAIAKQLNTAWEATMTMPSIGPQKLDKVKGAMMAMFTASENTVRLTAFEGAMAKGLKEGLSKPDAIAFARRVTETTQYMTGPGNIPKLFADANPLLRQFMQFPSRTVGFIAGPALEMGSAAQAGFLGRNWGALGRMALTSGLAYEAGQSFMGADLSHGLLFGALPIPHPEQPFAPIPMVPPIISIGGSIAQDILEGEFKHTPFVAPLAVPGGLAFGRLATIISPEVAQAIGRRFVRWDQKTDAGDVAMYSPGGGLIGYVSPWEAYMEGFGIAGGAGVLDKSQELVGYMVNQVDTIRQYKRGFLDSLARNESEQAAAIQDEFMQAYPMLGKIQVREQDLRAVHLRMQVPMLERVLETMPADARPMFGQLIAEVLAQEAESLMGVDPMLLQELPSISSRDPWRERPSSNVLEDLYRRKMDMGEVPYDRNFTLGYNPELESVSLASPYDPSLRNSRVQDQGASRGAFTSASPFSGF